MKNYIKIVLFFGLVLLNARLLCAQDEPTSAQTNPDSISVAYRYITQSKIGLHIIKKGQLFGTVNDTGLVVTPFNYESIAFFADVDSTCDHWEGVLKIKRGKKYALSYPDGKPFTDMNNDDIQFLKGSCGTNTPAAYIVAVRQNGKWGLVDAKGGLFIKAAYDDAKLLLTPDTLPTSPEILLVNKLGKFGMMNLRTQEVLPSQYESIVFHQYIKEKNSQYALLKLRMSAKVGIYNLKDKSQISNLYEEVGLFSDGLAPASKNRKFGYIDLKGTEKIKHQFENASSFRNGLAVVTQGNKGFIINSSGKPNGQKYESAVWLCAETNNSSFYKSLVLIKLEGKYGIHTAEGKEICAAKYESIQFNEKDNSCTGFIGKAEDSIVLRMPSK